MGWPDAQSPVIATVGDKQLCTDCERVERIARFDVTDGDGLVDESNYAVLAPNGMLLIGSSSGVRIYSDSGRFERKVGRRGQGPLEFEGPGPLLFDAQGTLYVYDQLAFRKTILTASTYELDTIRALPLGPVYRARMIDDSTVLVAAGFLERDAIGSPLHLLRGDSLAASFGGASDTVVQIGMLSLNTVPAGVFQDSLIISVRSDNYTIDAWRPSGEQVLRAARTGLWESYSEVSAKTGQQGRRPNGMVADALIAKHDLLVISLRPRADWEKRAVREDRPGAGPVVTFDMVPTEIYESVVERISLESGNVVSQTISQSILLRGFLSPTMLWGYSYGDDGRPILELLQLTRVSE